MIKAIKEKIRKIFRPRNCLVCPVCGSDVSMEEGCRVLSLNVDGTVGAYAVHRECELKIKEANPELKLKNLAGNDKTINFAVNMAT